MFTLSIQTVSNTNTIGPQSATVIAPIFEGLKQFPIDIIRLSVYLDDKLICSWLSREYTP